MNLRKKLLVTGASGFIGKYAVPILEKKFDVKTFALRQNNIEDVELKKFDAILFLTGIAHKMRDIEPNLYYDINQKLAITFAEKAKINGVKQFIYLSSTKVYNDYKEFYHNESSKTNPQDDYGKSKLAAENDLKFLESEHFVCTIIRPPIVYGPGVKGNIDALIKLVQKLPVVPFGKISNERSMVYVGNLVALFERLIERPSSGIYIAGDKKTVSTTMLVDNIIDAMSTRKTNFSFPLILRKVVQLLKPNIYSRLFQSLVIDNASTNQKLEFTPPYSLQYGVKEMINSYKKMKSNR